MSESISRRVRGLAALAGGLLLVFGALACASSAPTPGASPESQVISDVRVESQGDATIVTLMGPDHPVFTAFEQQDPDRLVVDVASVAPLGSEGPIAVYDGIIEEVALSPFASDLGEASTRVEITFATAGDYEVTPSDEGLAIRLQSLPGMEPMEEPMAADVPESPFDDDPWANLADAAPGDEPAEASGAELAQAPAATTLEAIETRAAGDGWIVHLRADGTIGSAMAFTLEDPARLVIDLPDLVSAVPDGRIDVDSAHASRVRVGQHSDHVRVVIDAGDAPSSFESRRVVPAPDGLLVALGAGAEVDGAVSAALAGGAVVANEPPSAPEPGEAVEPLAAADAAAPPSEEEPVPAAAAAAAASAPEAAGPGRAAKAPATIYGVEFDAQAAHDRIVVLGDEPVAYFVYEPSDETVVLSIENAVIAPEAAIRIAPEDPGPVSLVTAFEQPDTDTPEVRVVVQRASGLKPDVSRRGALLILDFARDGGVAATPPVLDQAAPDALAPAQPAESQPAPPQLAQAEAGAAPAPVPGSTASIEPIQNAADLPASIPPEGLVLATRQPADAASLEPPAAISLLNEGGLLDGKEYTGRRISLDFKDVEIADVLRLIAEVSNLNVIAGDEVKGSVTIRLVDVPWDQALDVILLTKGLGFARIGNVLRIASADVLAQEEEVRLQERRAKEKLEDLVVKLQPVNYANVGDVSGMVGQLLTPRGSVNVDKRTNTLIIKDIPTVIDEATALIKAIDTQTPQVMIESKIVEANLDFSREFGSVWGFGAQPFVDAFNPASGARTDLGSNDFLLNTTSANNVAFANPLTAGPTALWNLGAFILDEKLNLNVQLQAAEVNGDGKVISSPRVVTLDNTAAVIEQGVSIPFQTFENGDAALEFVDAVLALKVKPHITADRSIIMDIQVSRNAPDDSVFTLTGSPAIAKNQVQTETLVKDGQTLVIGGIYVVDTSQRQSRVPYLHNIPILGAAFRSDEFSDSRKELLIFVTPRVVTSQLEAR